MAASGVDGYPARGKQLACEGDGKPGAPTCQEGLGPGTGEGPAATAQGAEAARSGGEEVLRPQAKLPGGGHAKRNKLDRGAHGMRKQPSVVIRLACFSGGKGGRARGALAVKDVGDDDVDNQAARTIPANGRQVASALAGVRHAEEAETRLAAEADRPSFPDHDDKVVAEGVMATMPIMMVATKEVVQSEGAPAGTGRAATEDRGLGTQGKLAREG